MTTRLFLSSPRSLSRGLLGSLTAGITGGLFALALLAAPLSAQPTSSAESNPGLSTWEEYYGEQAALMLRSDNEMKRSLTLQTLIKVSATDRTVDLSPAVPALLELYESDATLEHRIMAATALRQVAEDSRVGDRIMQRLGELVADQSSTRVQRLTLLVLADYETERGRALRLPPDLYDLLMERGRA